MYVLVSFLTINSLVCSVQNSKYSRGLLGSSKSIFMLGLLVNRKCHSSPDCPYSLLHDTDVTFCSLSELTLSSPCDELLTFISLSLLCTLAEISLY
jgi:hypothetical protein